jgi:FAD:protein FMN transferase
MKRREWLIAGAALALLLGGVLVDRLRREPAPHKASFVIFGGITEVELRGTDDAAASAAFGAIGELLQRDQRAWHPWETSDLMRLNAAIAQGQPYQATPELAGLLRSAQQGYASSEGLFNPAIGSLITLWGFHTSNYPITAPPPPQTNIDATLATQARMDDLDIAADGTVSSRNPRVQLDLNGLAEGYAAEQIAALLASRGIHDALVNVGGDVLALGAAGERAWQVGISSPQHKTLAGAALRGHEALFSSGNYNKFREMDGQRWGHVLDPRSGRPARGVSAVSVIHNDAIVADVASTTLMIAGPDGLVQAARALGVRCVVLVDDAGAVWITPAMQQRLQFAVPPPRLTITEDLGMGCGG